MQEILDLGRQPIANGFLREEDLDKPEFFFNLKIGFNAETYLVSLMEQVNPLALFNEDYPYHSSGSKTMRDHFSAVAAVIRGRFEPESVLEIGSNDGVFLQNFRPETTFAIEPCSNFAAITNQMGYRTWPIFWEEETADLVSLANGGKPISVIYSANCMCHIPDIVGAFSAVASLMDEDSVFIFEDPSLESMLVRTSYDQIYDEHVHIFSILALAKLLGEAGMRIFDVNNLTVHGGSNRIFACLEESKREKSHTVELITRKEKMASLDKITTFRRFATNVEDSRIKLKEILFSLKDKGKKIIGYGATSKSTVVYNYCGIGPDLISHVVDNTPVKQGRYTPGTHIPIIPPGISEDVDYAFLGAWNFENEIMEKEAKFIERGGRFIHHVPTPAIVSGPAHVREARA